MPIDFKSLIPNINPEFLSTNKIAVAIQFLNFQQAQKELKLASELGADLVELRLDYLESLRSEILSKKKKDVLVNLDEEIFQNFAESIFPKNLISDLLKKNSIPIIFTLRKHDQGGQCNIPESLRIKLIKYLMNFSPDYFDIETNVEYEELLNLSKIAKQKGIKLIYSYHDWEKTPETEEIKRLIDNFIDLYPGIRNNNDYSYEKTNIIKIIFTAEKFQDNQNAIEICNFYATKGIKIVCFCMGIEGIPSRVGSLLVGGFFSFASITDNTAPGQINISDFQKYLKNANEELIKK